MPTPGSAETADRSTAARSRSFWTNVNSPLRTLSGRDAHGQLAAPGQLWTQNNQPAGEKFLDLPRDGIQADVDSISRSQSSGERHPAGKIWFLLLTESKDRRRIPPPQGPAADVFLLYSLINRRRAFVSSFDSAQSVLVVFGGALCGAMTTVGSAIVEADHPANEETLMNCRDSSDSKNELRLRWGV